MGLRRNKSNLKRQINHVYISLVGLFQAFRGWLIEVGVFHEIVTKLVVVL